MPFWIVRSLLDRSLVFFFPQLYCNVCIIGSCKKTDIEHSIFSSNRTRFSFYENITKYQYILVRCSRSSVDYSGNMWKTIYIGLASNNKTCIPLYWSHICEVKCGVEYHTHPLFLLVRDSSLCALKWTKENLQIKIHYISITKRKVWELLL